MKWSDTVQIGFTAADISKPLSVKRTLGILAQPNNFHIYLAISARTATVVTVFSKKPLGLLLELAWRD